jgi:hypothetical protein
MAGAGFGVASVELGRDHPRRREHEHLDDRRVGVGALPGVDHDVRLGMADGTSLRFALTEAPSVGETVRLRIDPARIIRFDTDEPSVARG